MGPGRGQLFWQAFFRKYSEGARLWGRLGVGPLVTLKAYRVYIASVLLFVGQFEDLPEDFRKNECQACRVLFPGPNYWMTPKCLKELRTLCFPNEFSDAYTTVQAAKAWVTKWEANGG